MRAEKISGRHKADIQVQIRIVIKLKTLIESENIQVKLVSNGKGYNQIDKKRVKDYIEMQQMPEEISSILKRFSGEEKRLGSDPRDSRRMFLNEFSLDEQAKIVHFFEENKTLVLSDILKGNRPYSAEWSLAIRNLSVECTSMLQFKLDPTALLNYHIK